MDSVLLEHDHAVAADAPPGLSVENEFCVRARVDGTVLARQGAMVAYRGDLDLRVHGQGVKRLLKRAVTGEGVALMAISGDGEVWLADTAKHVFLVTLAGEEQLTIAGEAVLAFDAAMAYDVRMVKGAGMAGGGLFNCVFSGPGTLAIASWGQPLAIPVAPGAPVFVDTDAVVGWSHALAASVHRSESAKSLLRGGSGEAFQLRLEGDGIVLVQPSEGLPQAKGGGGGLGDAVGELLS